MRLLATGALGVGLSGCLAFGALDKRATSINEGLGDAENVNLLLNLVRASRSEPLYFESMAGVHGSAQEDLRLGVPQWTLGPHQTIAQKQFSNGTNGSNFIDSQTATSFDVGVFNSKDFYAGMMTPLSLDEANLLFSQGYSRELVFYLLIDNLRVVDVTDLKPGADDSGAPTYLLYNDPSRSNYYDHAPNGPLSPTFERFIKEAMIHGLTTEAYAPAAEPATATTTQAAGGAPGVTVEVVEPAPTKPQGGGVHARLCYDYALTTPAAMDDFTAEKKNYPNENSRCGATGPVTRQQSSSLAVSLGGREYEITVTFRSILGIFNYLGHLVDKDPATVELRDYGVRNEVTTEEPLLDITTNQTSDCFTSVSYHGQRYCVPAKGEENTKRIFAILNALLALKTSPGDLPITQTVRITP